MYVDITVSYPLNFDSFVDLDEIIDLLADKYICQKVEGYFYENQRFIIYEAPGEQYAKEFTDALERLKGLKVYELRSDI